MPFTQRGELRLFQFESLLQHNLNHAVFTRRGGISPDPWRSLNLGGTVGDVPERVAENKRLALAALNRSPESVFEVWQVHSGRVLLAEGPRGAQPPPCGPCPASRCAQPQWPTGPGRTARWAHSRRTA